MNKALKPFWSRYFEFDWKFGLFLILLVCVPRFVLALQANVSGNYGSIGLIMVISALAPFVFLTKYGRKQAGITKPQHYKWLLLALVCGLLASMALYWLGQALYGNSYENWYVYIGKSYKIPASMDPKARDIMFAIMAFTGMTFSPIGEELFFRGIVHSAFAASFGDQKASFADGAAFAVTHIAHFGWVFLDGRWDFFVLPALIWVASMFLLSCLFLVFRKKSGSILGAIICHSAFNAGMIFSIFYLL